MNSYLRRLLALSCLFLCLGSARVYGQRYSFQNLSVDDGLIQSQPMCMVQDSMGNLWVGTLGGLSRYDGKSFTNYSIRNGLLSNMVQALAVDKYGNVWIGTRKGLSRFNGKTFVHYPLQQVKSGKINNTQQLQIVDDTVWWRTFGELYYVTAGKIKYYATPLKDNGITAMLVAPGSMWVASLDTVAHFSNGKWKSYAFLNKQGVYVHDIFNARDSGLLLGTNSGLYKLTASGLRLYQVSGQPLNWLQVRSVCEDRNGAIWLATGNGAVQLSNNGIRFYNKRNGLSDNLFLDVLQDLEGNIWLASDGQGLFRFSGTLFTVLDESMGLPSAQIVALASNKRDSLFLGTYEAGLFLFNNGKITPRALPLPTMPSITALQYTHDGNLWIGTRDNGLFRYRNGVFRQYTTPRAGMPSNAVFCMYESPDRQLYIGFDQGAIVYAGDSFSVLPMDNEHMVSFLAIGRDSLLAVTEKNGLLLYSNEVSKPFVTNTIVDSSSINCAVKMGNELWMGSSDNGVIVYNLDTKVATVVNRKDGLRSDFIYNITTDNQQQVWVGTGYGIHKIVMVNGSPKVTFYGREMGVTGTESNINAVLMQSDGSIWFGTTKGAMHYEPKATAVSPAPSAIVLQSVKLVGESTIDSSWFDSTDSWYGVPYHLKLPYRKNNITLSYAAISLAGSGQLLYRYQMVGLDAPWSEWTTATSVTFSALPPGKYTFRVACMGGALLQSPELIYTFEIETPFHKTPWFYFIVLCGCIIIGVLLQAAYSTQKERRHRLRVRLRAEEQAKVRLRTAEDFHDEVGNKLTRINVLTNILKAKVGPDPDVTRILHQIEDNTGQLYSGTRDILWSLKPSNDNLYEILFRINDFAGELFQDTEVRFVFTGIEDKWRKYRLPMDVNRNLTMVFKEALNNVLKYAKATHVTLEARMKRRDICVLILTDNGVGFDVRAPRNGNGLNNMLVRAERINGKLYLDSRQGKGTIMTLTFRVTTLK